jgi:hypothetical protein
MEETRDKQKKEGDRKEKVQIQKKSMITLVLGICL